MFPGSIYILKWEQVKANKSPIGRNCTSNVYEQGNLSQAPLLIIPASKEQGYFKMYLLALGGKMF